MAKSIFIRFVSITALCLLFTACSTPKQPPLPVGSLKLGVAPFTQPQGVHDMLAGYIPEEAPQIEQKQLADLDDLFAVKLSKETKHNYVPSSIAYRCMKDLPKDSSYESAIRKWSAVGRCMQVDLLIVPQMFLMQERDGSEIGVTTPAGVLMDTFIVDVTNESLISRSHYDEIQAPLTSNLLEAGKFFKRGAKWVKARELAKEGMDKAIKELGL